jgi:MoaA/NifB/PqqE/SkfB family radical SAM enzyme
MQASELQPTRLHRLKRVNTKLNNLEVLAGVAELRSVPSHLEIDFSSRCNLRCTMCHQSKLDMGKFQLSELDLDTLIDVLPYVETVMMAGLGEPLLYRGIKPFLPYLSRYGCHSHLFTNGELIDRHLDVLPHVQRISVSIDGASKPVFEYLRRGARFAHVVANVAKLRAAAPKTELVTSTVISNRNVHEVAAIVELAISLGMNGVNLSPVDHTPKLALGTEHQAVFVEQLQRATLAAKRAGMALHNNIFAQHFKLTRNAPITDDDELKVAQINAIDSTEEQALDPARRIAEQFIHGLTAAAERQEIERRITQQSTHLAKLKSALQKAPETLREPYCSAPWKYGFARSNGIARLCPYADIGVGKVGETLGGEYNSILLKQVRQSLADGEPLLDVCRRCTDDHRHFRRDSIGQSLREYQRARTWSGKLKATIKREP